MTSPSPSRRCRFLFQDYHRGNEIQRCRLCRPPGQKESWGADVCRKCPVSKLLQADPCAHLALEGRIERRWMFFRGMRVYSVCTARLREISQPASCQASCSDYQPTR